MTVSDQIISIIKELANQFGIAIDWTAENVLPYIQKLCEKFIKYEIATSILWIIIPIVLVVIMIPITIKLHKGAMALEKKNSVYDKAYDGDYAITFFAAMSWILLATFCVWAVIGLIVQSIDIATALTFPEKIIFDTISKMITTAQ